MQKRNNLVVLIGPTGVGKTELSLSLAEFLHSPIINADSRQIYSGLSIGTAAPTAEQMKRVPHHFVGILPPDAYYSAAQYESDVLILLNELFKSHEHVLLTGGSMMYVDAICKGIDDIPTVDQETRQMVMHRFEKDGLEQLTRELKILDPEYYKIVDLKNPKRVMHALEICYMTGKSYTSFRTNTIKERPFNILKIGLNRPREELYERINQRVDIMIKNGLYEEVRGLQNLRSCNALNTVGYKELFLYMDGQYTWDQAIEKIKQNSRNYARKQITWFKRDTEISWFHPDQEKEIIKYIADKIIP